MLTATVPITSGTFPETADHGGAGVACLIDTAPDAGLDLPCRTNNPDLWFADAPAELEKAKTFCVGCPVIAECLAGALARHEPWGVWGGEIFERGAVIARKRPRGRPRKDAAPVVPAAPAATVVRGGYQPGGRRVTTNRITSDELHHLDHKNQGIGRMLLHEDLARARMRDSENLAERQRLARRLIVANRWRRLSGWAQKRALHSARDL